MRQAARVISSAVLRHQRKTETRTRPTSTSRIIIIIMATHRHQRKTQAARPSTARISSCGLPFEVRSSQRIGRFWISRRDHIRRQLRLADSAPRFQKKRSGCRSLRGELWEKWRRFFRSTLRDNVDTPSVAVWVMSSEMAARQSKRGQAMLQRVRSTALNERTTRRRSSSTAAAAAQRHAAADEGGRPTSCGD